MTRPDNTPPEAQPNPICRHGDSNYQVSPYDGDVWCFACKPPRNISEDLRRMNDMEWVDDTPR